MIFYRENGKIRFGHPEKKMPAPEPEPVIAGSKAEPLGILPESETPTGMASIRILKGAVVNGRPHVPGEEITVPLDVALLLKADGKAQIMSLLPPPEPEEQHPFRAGFIAKMRQRMRRASHSRNALTDWIYSPIGGRFDAFR